ncbi:nicotinamide-nucleotide amidase [Peptoniphilus olsenii]|uniref:Putative competence-damage inducible protein n=1 Tax=Peptoniphilus olsenii TaxID=411570 RepID=A0ABV2J6Y1_9FIRM
MKAAIITIGKELLIGSILNSNSKYISAKLTDLGVEVLKQVSLDDNMEDILEELKTDSKKFDLIILIGGLGPTNDDITRESLAKFLDKKIYLDQTEKKLMEKRFLNNSSKMTSNNLKQICLIEGSTKLNNDWGVALGELIEYEDTTYILLPGPPNEMEPMVDKFIPNIINSTDKIIIKSLDVIGLGESKVEDTIRRLNIEKDNISINTFAHQGFTEIKIIGISQNSENIILDIDTIIDKLYTEFSEHIYSEKNVEVSQILVSVLKKNKLKISFAESITGGMLASSITDIGGAAEIMDSSYVTYSNDSKIQNLDVNPKTLSKYGAISQQTALEMARGLKKRTGTDIAISTTGEAGPKPSETDVGNVYSCIYFDEDKYFLKHYFFNGDRNKIRNRTVNSVLSQLLYVLNKK